MTRKWIWTSIAISSMWIAVLFASVFGGDIVVESAVDRVTTPMGVAVAAFAFVPTIVAAAVGFRGESGNEARSGLEEGRAEHRLPAAGTSH